MSNAKHIFEQVAPYLGKALVGDFGGIAAQFLTSKLGKDELLQGTKLDEFLESFVQTHENLQKLQEIDHQFKLEMEKLNIDVFASEVEDRKSARQMAEKDNRPQMVMSALFIFAYFVLLIAMFWAEISPDFNPGMYKTEEGIWEPQGESLIDLFQVLLGVLTAGVAQILNFWFGGLFGSRGNSDKN